MATLLPSWVKIPRVKKIFNCNDVGKQVVSVDEKVISYDDVGKQAVHVDAYNAQSEPSRPTEGRKIFGLTRTTFFILLAVALVLIIAAAVGGGVIGTSAARNSEFDVGISRQFPFSSLDLSSYCFNLSCS